MKLDHAINKYPAARSALKAALYDAMSRERISPCENQVNSNRMLDKINELDRAYNAALYVKKAKDDLMLPYWGRDLYTETLTDLYRATSRHKFDDNEYQWTLLDAIDEANKLSALIDQWGA